MRKYILFFAALLGMAAGPCANAIDFVTGVTVTGNLRNDSAGQGMIFTNTTGTTVPITELGRYCVSGNSRTHVIGIYTTSAVSSLAASVTVDASLGTPGTFQYATLTTPYEVPAGATIRIISAENLDQFNAQINGPPVVRNQLTTTDIGSITSAFINGSIISDAGGSSTSMGPVAFRYSSPVQTWNKTPNGTVPETYTYTMTGGDGSWYQIKSALADSASSPGSTVVVPAGSFTWFPNATLSIPTGNKLVGAGSGSTIITVASNAPSGYGTSLFSLNTNSLVSGMQIIGNSKDLTMVFQVASSTTIDCRVKDIKTTPTTNRLLFLYNNQTFSACQLLIDNCDITGYSGNSELIYSRGTSGAWNSPSGAGDGAAIYIEDTIFRGLGYVCDANANAKIVIRNCLITGQIKIDGHGIGSNTPYQGYRRIEAYWNRWDGASIGNWAAFELRGSSNYIWNNESSLPTGSATFLFRDYGYVNLNVQFGNIYQTPFNYPIGYQVGTGPRELMDVEDVVAGQMVMVEDLGDTPWGDMGGTASEGAQFIATGPGTGTGTVTTTPAAGEPAYVWGNTNASGAWPRQLGSIASGTIPTNAAGYAAGSTVITTTGSVTLNAGNYVSFPGDSTRYRLTASRSSGSPTLQITPALVNPIPASVTLATYGAATNYQAQTGNPSATFTDRTIILSNRDLFATAGFDTNTGMTVGTSAQRLAFSTVGLPVGYGFWVTDEGSWNTENNSPGTGGYQKGQGVLYAWDGADWNIIYTPYTYPHPLTGSAPTVISAEVNSAGNMLSFGLSESCTTGAGGNGGVTMDASGGPVTLTYSSGSGTTTYNYSTSRTIIVGEELDFSYVQPGAGIEATTGGADLPSFSDFPVTNSSEQGSTINATTINVTNLVIGP